MTTTDVDAEQPRPTTRRTPAPRPVPRGRLALLLGGGVAMLLGLDAGLLLLGLPAPVTTERLPEVHGQLMLIGFLGTVIALERAVALRRPWGFSAPLATGLGSLLLLTALPVAVGQGVQLIGLSVLVGIYGALWRRAASTAVAIQWLGAFLAAGGVLLWTAGVATGALFPWLAGFLVLTIAGERLELAHVAAPGRALRPACWRSRCSRDRRGRGPALADARGPRPSAWPCWPSSGGCCAMTWPPAPCARWASPGTRRSTCCWGWRGWRSPAVPGWCSARRPTAPATTWSSTP